MVHKGLEVFIQVCQVVLRFKAIDEPLFMAPLYFMDFFYNSNFAIWNACHLCSFLLALPTEGAVDLGLLQPYFDLTRKPFNDTVSLTVESMNTNQL